VGAPAAAKGNRQPGRRGPRRADRGCPRRAPRAKEALLADDPDVYFTTAHFDGSPAILARLQRIPAEDLYELVTEAWLARAPAPLVKAFLKQPL